MSNFAILRVSKLKSVGEISGSAKHTLREIPTANADPDRLSRNQNVGAKSTKQIIAKFREKWPEKLRKNGVIGVEYLITASPERFNDKGFKANEYFQDSLNWLEKKHGKENIVSAHTHYDETTPHLVVYVVPKDEKGKMNARNFFGGRAKMSAMQSSFAHEVGKPHGLKRGIKGSKAKHKTIKQFYAELNASAKQAGSYKPTRLDFLKGFFGLNSEHLRAQQKAADLSAALALQSRLDKEREKVVLNEVETVNQELERIREATQTKEQELESKAKNLREEQRNLDALKADLLDKLESGDRAKEDVEVLKADLNASKTLSERLEAALRATQRELEEERSRGDCSAPSRRI